MTSKEQLHAAIEVSNWALVSRICDEVEFDATTSPEHTIQFLTYLLLDQIQEARFLWKRIPEALRTPEISSAYRLFCCLWHREHANFFQEVQASQEVWSPTSRPVAEAMVLAVRERVLDLVSQSFLSIPTTELASMMGVDGLTAEQAARDRNWTAAGDGFIRPVVVAQTSEPFVISDMKLKKI